MEKNHLKRNLIIALFLGALIGYGVIQGYFYILFSGTHWIPLWLVKVYVYTLMFPHYISSFICYLQNIKSFDYFYNTQYVFPITYAIIFPLIYYIYHRIKTRKSS